MLWQGAHEHHWLPSALHIRKGDFHFSLSWCFLVGRGSVLQSICLLFSALKWAVSVEPRQVMGQGLVTYKVPEQLARVTCVPGGEIWVPNFSLFKLKIFKWREKNVSICLQSTLLVLPSTRRLNIMIRCWNRIVIRLKVSQSERGWSWSVT